MPLIAARVNGEADQICAICGAERTIKTHEWIGVEGDKSVLAAPPCPCGAQETLNWHDDVYHVRKTIYEQIGTVPHPDHPHDEDRRLPQYVTKIVVEADPEHPMARHMKLLEKVAQAKGLKQRKTGPKLKYATEPVAPMPDTMRVLVAKVHPEVADKIAKNNAHLSDKIRMAIEAPKGAKSVIGLKGDRNG